MNDAYDDVPPQVRAMRRRDARLRAEWAALAAEAGEFDGDTVTGLVAQQRRRARIANRRSLWVLAALMVVIAFGIAFYLGQPFLRQYLDGRKLTLEGRIAALEPSLQRLEEDRETLRASLAESLRQTPETLDGDWSDRVSFQGVEPAGDGALLIFGDMGTLLRYDIGTGQARSLAGDWSDNVHFQDVAPSGDGALLIFGDMGTLLRYDIGTGQARALTGDWSDNVYFQDVAPAGDGALLVLGDMGTLLRYDIATGQARALTGDWSDNVRFEDVEPAGDGALLLWGNEIDSLGSWTGDGTLVRYDTVSGAAQTIDGDWPDNVTFRDVAPAGDGALLVLGDMGTLLRYDIGTGQARALTGDWSDNVRFRDVATSGDGALLVLGDMGTLLRYDIGTGQARSLAGDWSDNVYFQDVAPSGDGALLVLGDMGTLLRYDITTGQARALTGDWPDNVYFWDVAPAGDGALLVLGRIDPFPFEDRTNYGTLLRYDIPTGQARALAGDWSDGVDFYGVAPAGDGALLLGGSEGTLLRYDIATGEARSLDGDWSASTAFLQGIPAGDGALLVLGLKPFDINDPSSSLDILVRYDIATGRARALAGNWSDSAEISGFEPAGDGALLLFGDRGTLVLISDTVAEALLAAKIDGASAITTGAGNQSRKGAEDDAARDALELAFAALPADVQGYPEVVGARAEAAQIRGQREELEKQLAEARGSLDTWLSGVFGLNQKRERFSDFMAVCRGVESDPNGPPAPRDGLTDADPDAVTLACTQAWAAELDRERQTWWQTIAAQVPPGVLLLFLLATLGGLYRYNLRLAGFHASRADALELLAAGRGDSDLDRLAAISDAMAADKVEFGKANTPSDQAVEIVRAIMSRGKS